MTNKLMPWKIGVTLGFVFAIISLICAILFAITPESTLNLGNNIFHGLDLTKIAKDMSWNSAAIGLVEIFIIGFVGGWLFGVIYNLMNKGGKK